MTFDMHLPCGCSNRQRPAWLLLKLSEHISPYETRHYMMVCAMQKVLICGWLEGTRMSLLLQELDRGVHNCFAIEKCTILPAHVPGMCLLV